jgi:A nuclease family of the HNH/ENDO VII superfamily with conserved AHH
LIPVNIVGRPAFRQLFMLISTVGFDARHFPTNGVLLPATEEMAAQTGLALHRGPHHQYDQLVAEYLCQISNELGGRGAVSGIAAFEKISGLQGVLRRALGHDASMMLNRSGPRYLQSPMAKLDYDAMQLMHLGLLI